MEWSAPEFILLFVIALVVLGPERMAQVAKKLGQFVGYARRMSRNLQIQLEDELEMKNIRDSLPKRVNLREELGLDDLAADIKGLSDAPAVKDPNTALEQTADKPVADRDAPQTKTDQADAPAQTNSKPS